MTEPATDRIAKAIARQQMRELDGLALTDHPTRFTGGTRVVVAHALRLGARTVMEREQVARGAG